MKRQRNISTHFASHTPCHFFSSLSLDFSCVFVFFPSSSIVAESNALALNLCGYMVNSQSRIIHAFLENCVIIVLAHTTSAIRPTIYLQNVFSLSTTRHFGNFGSVMYTQCARNINNLKCVHKPCQKSSPSEPSILKPSRRCCVRAQISTKES